MKRLIIAALCALGFVSCDRGFSFEVEWPTQYPNATYYLTPEGQPGNYYMKADSDSEGVVRFKGRLRQPIVACISDGYAMLTRPFFVEEGSISFGNLSPLNPLVVAMGTPSNNAYNDYLLQLQQVEQTYAADSTIVNAEQRMAAAIDSLGLAIQHNNMDNILGVYLFVNEGIHNVSSEQIDSIMAEFSPAMRCHPYVEEAVAAMRNK